MNLPVSEIARYLRLGGHAPEGALADRIVALRAAALDALAPRSVFARFPRARFPWPSTRLAAHLGTATDIVLVAGTLGAPFDAFLRRTATLSASDAFIVQAIGAAAIEEHLDAREADIRATLAPGETLLARFSPGYGDFPLAANATIVTALDTAKRIGVSVSAANALVPSKSVTAVIGIV